MNRNQLAHLDRRAAVPRGVRELLRRSLLLDLLEPVDDAELVVHHRPMGQRLLPNESSAGYDYSLPLDQCHLVLVVEQVNYPVQGYPEAYIGWEPEYV